MSKPAIEFHVSLQGSDAWNGRAALAASGGVGPVASLTRAQQLLRELKRGHGGRLPAPVRILIHPGYYELAETLVLTPEDSGSAPCPVTWTGTEAGQAVLSGGSRIAGWQRGEHAGRAAWRTTLPAVAAGAWSFQQLFVNGARRSRPVLPKEGYYRFAGAPEGQHGFWHRVGCGQVRPGDLPVCARPDEVEIITYQLWFTNHLRIASVDRATNVVTFRTKGWHTLHDSDNQLCRYRLVNVREALSAPGEWYLDERSGELTYLPTSFEEALGPVVPAEFVAPRLDCLLRLEGSQDADGAKVEHVHFEHLSFQHAGWQLPVGNPGAIQSAFTVPGAIQLRGAADCAFYACEVAHVGQYGIEIQRGSIRTSVVACHLHDLGAGGIKINHESGLTAHSETNDAAFEGLDPVAMGWGPLHRDGGGLPRPGIDRSPGGHHHISDCHIHHGGAVFPSACGIWIGDSGYNDVLFNHIHHLHYTGISVGWNWNYAPAFAMANRIEGNHLHDITCSDQLHDLAAIYLLGRQPGTVVRGNVVEAVHCGGYGGNCIYPDQGASFMRFEGNLMLGAPYNTIGGNNAESLVIRGNLIYGRPGQVALMHENMATSRLSYIVEDNLFLSAGAPIIGATHGNKIFRNNLYGNLDARPCRFEGQDLAGWLARGLDSGSGETDPKVADIGSNDIVLRPGSPLAGHRDLLTLAERVGPRHRPDRCLPATLDAWPHEVHATLPELLVPSLNAGDPASLDQSVTSEPPFIELPAGQATRFSYQVHNVGQVRSRGRATLVLDPLSGILVGTPVLDYDLAPGEAASISVQVILTGSPTATTWLLARPAESSPLPLIGRLLRISG